MATLSERLSDLSVRTKQLEDHAAASRAASRETMERNISEARANAAKARSDLQSRIDAASERATANWQEAQASINAWADEMRRRQAQRRAERDTERAHDAA